MGALSRIPTSPPSGRGRSGPTSPPGVAPGRNGPDRAGVGLGSLIRGTLVYGVGSVLNRIVTFLLLPVLTRYLSTGEYGISALLDVLCAMLVAVFSLGIGSSLTICYFDSREPSARQRAVSTAFVVLLASVTVLLVAGVGGRATVSRWSLGDPGHPGLVVLCLATTAAMILQQPFSMSLQFEERATRLVTVNLVSTVLLVLFSLLGVVVLGRGVRGLWEGRLAAHAVTLAVFLLHFPRPRRLRFRGRVAAELLRLGLPMVPSFASVFVLLQGNRYILSLFADLDTVGVYSVGVQLGMVMGLAVTAFSTAWTPYFMSFADRRDEAPLVFSRVATYYLLGFGALSLLFFAFARPGLMILTARPFHRGFRVAGFAATAQWMLGAFNVLMPACTFAREIKYSGLIQAVAALLAIGVNLALIPALGMMGAGLALAAGPALMTALLGLWNRSRGESYLRVPYEWHRLLPFAALYAALAALLVRDRRWGLPLELGVGAAATLLVGGVVWLLLDRGARGSLKVLPARLWGSVRGRTGSTPPAREGGDG